MTRQRPAAAKLSLERRHAKLIIPTVGLLAAYAGAFLAMMVFSLRRSSSWTALLLVESLAGLGAGLAAMIPVDRWLGEKASHVDLLKIPLYWAAAAIALYAADWVLEAAKLWAIPPFASNLILWLAGVLAVWVEEPRS